MAYRKEKNDNKNENKKHQNTHRKKKQKKDKRIWKKMVLYRNDKVRE